MPMSVQVPSPVDAKESVLLGAVSSGGVVTSGSVVDSKRMGGVVTGGCPSYLENVFELLGKPMEWYFDRTEQMLYLGLEEGDTPDNHEIVIPLVEQMMEKDGLAVENELNF